MSSENFDLSLKYVLVDEGGNDDDPNDHGGRTSRGITQREYDAWCQLNGKTSGDVWNATQEEISTIYNTQYWAPYCNSFPSGVDYVFFDIAVNAGRSQAVRSFQKALGVNVDGMMGQVTLAAIQSADPTKLIQDVSEVRRNFYRSLKQFPRYGKGWLNRVNHCQTGALSMVNTTYVKPVDTIPTPKADENDTAQTTISPEASGGTAVATGGLISMLDNFKESLSGFAGDIQYIKYVLIGVTVLILGYSVYGFYKRSQVQAAT